MCHKSSACGVLSPLARARVTGFDVLGRPNTGMQVYRDLRPASTSIMALWSGEAPTRCRLAWLDPFCVVSAVAPLQQPLTLWLALHETTEECPC